MPNITIRRANLEDVVELLNFAKKVFYDSFIAQNTEENMQQYLSKAFTIPKFKSELENPDSQFYVAISDNEIIGYLKINFGKAQTELQDNQALEIERIYVAKEFQGKRVGESLLKKALEIAQNAHLQYIWLGVWEKNLKAIAFYEKQGFKIFDKHIFRMGEEDQTDWMMKLNL
ncbi:MAG: GNAT family N-acetyltransferase [Thermoflexibacter sp.]